MFKRIRKATSLLFNVLWFVLMMVWIGIGLIVVGYKTSIAAVSSSVLSVILIMFYIWMWRDYVRPKFQEYEKQFKSKPRWVWAPGDYDFKINGKEYFYPYTPESWVVVRPDDEKGKTYFKKRFYINEESETLDNDLLELAAVNKKAAKEMLSKFRSEEYSASSAERKYKKVNEQLKVIRELVEA